MLRLYLLTLLLSPCFGVFVNYLARQNADIVNILNFYSQFPDAAELDEEYGRPISIIMNGFWRKVLNKKGVVDLTLSTKKLAADPRRNMNLVRAALDMPINIISMSCNGYVKDRVCLERISNFTARQKKLCPGFKEHHDFYAKTVEVFTSKKFEEFDKYVREQLFESKADAVAMNIVQKTLKSPKAAKFLEWGTAFAKGNFPCKTVQLNENIPKDVYKAE